MDKGRSAFKILTDKPTGRRPLERPRCRWENSIRMDHEVGANMRDWTDLAQNRDYLRAFVNVTLNLQIQ